MTQVNKQEVHVFILITFLVIFCLTYFLNEFAIRVLKLKPQIFTVEKIKKWNDMYYNKIKDESAKNIYIRLTKNFDAEGKYRITNYPAQMFTGYILGWIMLSTFSILVFTNLENFKNYLLEMKPITNYIPKYIYIVPVGILIFYINDLIMLQYYKKRREISVLLHHFTSIIFCILYLNIGIIQWDVGMTLSGVFMNLLCAVTIEPVHLYKTVCWWKTFNICGCTLTLQKAYLILFYTFRCIMFCHISLQIITLTYATYTEKINPYTTAFYACAISIFTYDDYRTSVIFKECSKIDYTLITMHLQDNNIELEKIIVNNNAKLEEEKITPMPYIEAVQQEHSNDEECPLSP